MPPDLRDHLVELKAERALVAGGLSEILDRNGDRLKGWSKWAERRRLDAGFARLREINREIGEIFDAWQDEPELPYLVVPDWPNVGRAVTLIQRRIDQDPASRANADRLGALIRDRFDGLGLRITDPETLYVALVVVGIMVEITRNGLEVEDGPVTPEILHVVALVAESFTAGVMPHLPPEART